MVSLTRLGIHDVRMQDSIDLILQARQPDGKWLLKNSFNGKMHIDIEEKHKPSKDAMKRTNILRKYSYPNGTYTSKK